VSGPVAIPARIGLPYHGLCTGGAIALPNGTTQASPQPDGGGTVVVASPSPPVYLPSTTDLQLDVSTGKQWLNYAYLSGKGKMLGGKEIDTSAKGTGWITRSTGYWIYHDGATAWLMKWEVTPAHRASQFNDVHALIITIVKPFGLFGDGYSGVTWTPREILNTRFSPDDWDFYDNDSYEVYLALHSKTGAKSAFTLGWRKQLGCDINFPDFLSIYPWLTMSASLERWIATIFGGENYCDLLLSGVGSRAAVTMGQGITAELTTRKWMYEEAASLDENPHIRTVSPDGTYGIWIQDDYLQTITGPGGTASFTVDSCYEFDGSTAPDIGVQLVDNCYLKAKEGATDWTMLHLQAGPPGANGVSYDIVNDEWSTTADSCYV
jgi:hypothetical protein